jgi:citrate lyase subunit beta/citryl-CoA lyase
LTQKVRRSWLLVSASNEDRIARAHLAEADVVVLDLVEFVAETHKPSARDRVAEAIDQVKAGGAEVFAQVDPELLYADLRASIWPGLSGVIIANLESAEQMAEADELLDRLEEERGISPNTLEIVGALESAQGNLQGYEIAAASPRCWGLTLGRADLVMDLRPEPSGEIHLMPYLMQRLITLANAAGVVPLGAWFRAPDRGLLATPENTYRAAFRGRTIGFKGCFCIQEEQVGPLNQGFTPTDFEVGAARSLLAAFDEALTQGSAATRWDDRIIDKGAAAQAQSLIALAAECAVRDEAKAAALEQRPVPAP